MANLKLVDTGYCRKDRTGAVTPVMNSGTAINLTKSADFKLTKDVNYSATPEPGNIANNPVDTNFVSSNNDEYTLKLTLKSTNVADREILKHLVGVKDDSDYPGVEHTQGVKALYISGTSDSRKTVVELCGSTSTDFHGAAKEIPVDLPAFLVGGVKLAVTDNPSSDKINITLTLVEA